MPTSEYLDNASKSSHKDSGSEDMAGQQEELSFDTPPGEASTPDMDALRSRLRATISDFLPEFYEFHQTGRNILFPKPVDIKTLKERISSMRIPALIQPLQKELEQAANAFLDRFRLFRKERGRHNYSLEYVKFRSAVKEAGWDDRETRDYNEALKHANRLSGYLAETLDLISLLNENQERLSSWEDFWKKNYDVLRNEILPMDADNHRSQYAAKIRGNLTKNNPENIKFETIVNSVTLDERLVRETLSAETKGRAERLLSSIALTRKYAEKADKKREATKLASYILDLCQVLKVVIKAIQTKNEQIQPSADRVFAEHRLPEQEEEHTIAEAAKRQIVKTRGVMTSRAQRAKAVFDKLSDKANKNRHRIAYKLPSRTDPDTDTGHGKTNEAVFRAGMILLDKIQQTTANIYKIKQATRPLQQAVTQSDELDKILYGMQAIRILDEKLISESGRWKGKAEGAENRLLQALEIMMPLKEAREKNEFLSNLRAELNRASLDPASRSIISDFDAHVKIIVERLATIEAGVNQAAVRLSKHGEVGGRELNQYLWPLLQQLDRIKGELKTNITQATGRSINNFSRHGMLARRMGEWNEAEKQRYLEELSAEDRAVAETQYDTLFLEVIQDYLPLLSKENDPEGERLLQRLRLEVGNAAEGTTLYPATMAEILAGMKSTERAIRDWSRRKLVRGAFLAACLQGVKLIPKLASLPLRIAIKFVITGAKVAWVAHKGQIAIRGGEGDVNDEIREYAKRSFKTATIKVVLSLPPGLATMLGVASIVLDVYEGGLQGAAKKIAKDIVGEAPWRALDVGSRMATINYTKKSLKDSLDAEEWLLDDKTDTQVEEHHNESDSQENRVGPPTDPGETLTPFSAQKELSRMADSADQELKALAARLLAQPGIGEVPLWQSNLNGRSFYNVSGRWIKLSAGASDWEMMHEITHSLTAHKLRYGLKHPSSELGQLVARLDILRSKASAAYEGTEPDTLYYLSNLDEFVAGLYSGNSDFINHLKAIDADGRSLLSLVMEAICSVLGLTTEHESALTRAMGLTDEVMGKKIPAGTDELGEIDDADRVLFSATGGSGNTIHSGKDRALDELMERHRIPKNLWLKKDSKINIRIGEHNMLGNIIATHHKQINIDALVTKSESEWLDLSLYTYPEFEVVWSSAYPSALRQEIRTAAFRERYLSSIERSNAGPTKPLGSQELHPVPQVSSERGVGEAVVTKTHIDENEETWESDNHQKFSLQGERDLLAGEEILVSVTNELGLVEYMEIVIPDDKLSKDKWPAYVASIINGNMKFTRIGDVDSQDTAAPIDLKTGEDNYLWTMNDCVVEWQIIRGGASEGAAAQGNAQAGNNWAPTPYRLAFSRPPYSDESLVVWVENKNNGELIERLEISTIQDPDVKKWGGTINNSARHIRVGEQSQGAFVPASDVAGGNVFWVDNNDYVVKYALVPSVALDKNLKLQQRYQFLNQVKKDSQGTRMHFAYRKRHPYNALDRAEIGRIFGMDAEAIERELSKTRNELTAAGLSPEEATDDKVWANKERNFIKGVVAFRSGNPLLGSSAENVSFAKAKTDALRYILSKNPALANGTGISSATTDQHQLLRAADSIYSKMDIEQQNDFIFAAALNWKLATDSKFDDRISTLTDGAGLGLFSLREELLADYGAEMAKHLFDTHAFEIHDFKSRNEFKDDTEYFAQFSNYAKNNLDDDAKRMSRLLASQSGLSGFDLNRPAKRSVKITPKVLSRTTITYRTGSKDDVRHRSLIGDVNLFEADSGRFFIYSSIGGQAFLEDVTDIFNEAELNDMLRGRVSSESAKKLETLLSKNVSLDDAETEGGYGSYNQTIGERVYAGRSKYQFSAQVESNGPDGNLQTKLNAFNSGLLRRTVNQVKEQKFPQSVWEKIRDSMIPFYKRWSRSSTDPDYVHSDEDSYHDLMNLFGLASVGAAGGSGAAKSGRALSAVFRNSAPANARGMLALFARGARAAAPGLRESLKGMTTQLAAEMFPPLDLVRAARVGGKYARRAFTAPDSMSGLQGMAGRGGQSLRSSTPFDPKNSVNVDLSDAQRYQPLGYNSVNAPNNLFTKDGRTYLRQNGSIFELDATQGGRTLRVRIPGQTPHTGPEIIHTSAGFIRKEPSGLGGGREWGGARVPLGDNRGQPIRGTLGRPLYGRDNPLSKPRLDLNEAGQWPGAQGKQPGEGPMPVVRPTDTPWPGARGKLRDE
ncbi:MULTISPECIES: hypothetical protein [unclassified Burkholderia]|uniref:hypothetical protein n=1 Tax=unclassified Burkholderia TaxID=2613784 RepID=UPI000AC81C84|nr:MULTISPECIES: hypothetical protein [unclassified Burkholderia]